VIPSMILFGLVLGRWWRTTLVLAALLWPVLVWGPVREGPGDPVAGLLLAACLGVANAAVGVAVHQAVLWAVRGLRRAAGRKPTREIHSS